jgi:stress-induced morphogen
MTQEQMVARLTTAFPSSQIEVYDLTGTQDHWEVHVASNRFVGLARIQQHKLVMQAFEAELKTGEVHALTMKTKEI